jgi:hypothetical protein
VESVLPILLSSHTAPNPRCREQSLLLVVTVPEIPEIAVRTPNRHPVVGSSLSRPLLALTVKYAETEIEIGGGPPAAAHPRFRCRAIVGFLSSSDAPIWQLPLG